MGYCNSIHCFM